MKRNFKKISGFTLVETLVAISIFSLSIVVSMSVLGGGLSNTNYAKQKMIAIYLAQEGIEYARNMRDAYALYYPIDEAWDAFKERFAGCRGKVGCGINNKDLEMPVTDPAIIFSCVGPNCKIYFEDGAYYGDPLGVGASSGFVRELKMTEVNANDVKISSSIIWDRGRVTLTENLFNWIE